MKFEDEGIDKDTFLSLGDSDSINILIPKIGPRVKFKKRLKENLQRKSMKTGDFVRDKLIEWDLAELIQRFEGKVQRNSSALLGIFSICDGS